MYVLCGHANLSALTYYLSQRFQILSVGNEYVNPMLYSTVLIRVNDFRGCSHQAPPNLHLRTFEGGGVLEHDWHCDSNRRIWRRSEIEDAFEGVSLDDLKSSVGFVRYLFKLNDRATLLQNMYIYVLGSFLYALIRRNTYDLVSRQMPESVDRIYIYYSTFIAVYNASR